MSRKRKGRPVNGIVLLDKESGISSNKALQQVKHLFNAQKAGHTGSLDPLASGMLPICLGEATKFSHYLLESDKTYQVSARLGVRTTTCDSEGEIVKTAPVPLLKQTEFDNLLTAFRGEIMQTPSMYSALKHQGQPLYKLARQGVEVERQARAITIHSLTLLTLEAESFDLLVHCSKGTYIRNLVDDIGEALGCGAHVTSLRRIGVQHYPQEQMLTFTQLQALAAEGENALDQVLLAMDTAIADWPSVIVGDELAFYLRRGQAVSLTQKQSAGLVRMHTQTEQFLGVGELAKDGRLMPKRLINYSA